jgi:hypothetical protein
MNKIAEIIERTMEPSEPQGKILEFFKQNKGKRLDKRFIDKLKAFTGLEEIRFGHVAGMTNIIWGNRADMTKKDPGGSLLVGYASEGTLYANPEQFEERNIAYFGASVERNAARQRALADVAGQENLLAQIEAYKAARDALKAIFAHGTDFSTIEYSVREEFGIQEKR